MQRTRSNDQDQESDKRCNGAGLRSDNIRDATNSIKKVALTMIKDNDKRCNKLDQESGSDNDKRCNGLDRETKKVQISLISDTKKQTQTLYRNKICQKSC